MPVASGIGALQASARTLALALGLLTALMPPPVWAQDRTPLSGEAVYLPQPLQLAAPIRTWDEGIPLGNGLTGGLLWGEGNTIRLSLDRGDLWDLRTPAMLQRPDWKYATLQRLQAAGDQAELERLFDEPYEAVAYPTKIPCARLQLTLPAGARAERFLLDLQHALGLVEGRNVNIESLFSAVHPVTLLRIEGEAPTYELIRPKSLDKLGYDMAQQGRDTHGTWLLQSAALGLQYAVVVGERREGNQSVLAIAITSTHDAHDPLRLARERVRAALANGYVRERDAHETWWRNFWTTSSIRIPVPRLQFHYDLVKYFYGAASRRHAPPMPLQGVWTADSDRLPPWKGDYHHDLNTQMTYLAYPAAGLFESGGSFIDFNWKLLPAYRRFAREFYGVSGAIVPGVMTIDGRPMGGWSQYALSPTNGLWVGQSFYLHWRYTMDRRFLAERAYPWLREITEGVVGLLRPDSNGHLKLPLSSSPEIFDNSAQAWLTPNSNYDQALISWAFDALAEMADALQKPTEAAHWRQLRAQQAPLAVDSDSGALAFAKGLSYRESHRHFSHAMAIYPLGTLNIEGTERDQKTIAATRQQIERYGTHDWVGYSFVWMAAMAARTGDGERALRYLTDFERAFLLRNGFHANGDQSGTGLSGYRYRPFTLEGNMLAMQATQEMLLQSWGGIVRVFPAAPASWADISFRDLRAEGGYRVSARRQAGRTQSLSIKATVAGTLHLRNDFGRAMHWNRNDLVQDGRDLVVQLARGDVLTGVARTFDESKNYVD